MQDQNRNMVDQSVVSSYVHSRMAELDLNATKDELDELITATYKSALKKDTANEEIKQMIRALSELGPYPQLKQSRCRNLGHRVNEDFGPWSCERLDADRLESSLKLDVYEA